MAELTPELAIAEVQKQFPEASKEQAVAMYFDFLRTGQKTPGQRAGTEPVRPASIIEQTNQALSTMRAAPGELAAKVPVAGPVLEPLVNLLNPTPGSITDVFQLAGAIPAARFFPKPGIVQSLKRIAGSILGAGTGAAISGESIPEALVTGGIAGTVPELARGTFGIGKRLTFATGQQAAKDIKVIPEQLSNLLPDEMPAFPKTVGALRSFLQDDQKPGSLIQSAIDIFGKRLDAAENLVGKDTKLAMQTIDPENPVTLRQVFDAVRDVGKGLKHERAFTARAGATGREISRNEMRMAIIDELGNELAMLPGDSGKLAFQLYKQARDEYATANSIARLFAGSETLSGTGLFNNRALAQRFFELREKGGIKGPPGLTDAIENIISRNQGPLDALDITKPKIPFRGSSGTGGTTRVMGSFFGTEIPTFAGVTFAKPNPTILPLAGGAIGATIRGSSNDVNKRLRESPFEAAP